MTKNSGIKRQSQNVDQKKKKPSGYLWGRKEEAKEVERKGRKLGKKGKSRQCIQRGQFQSGGESLGGEGDRLDRSTRLGGEVSTKREDGERKVIERAVGAIRKKEREGRKRNLNTQSFIRTEGIWRPMERSSRERKRVTIYSKEEEKTWERGKGTNFKVQNHPEGKPSGDGEEKKENQELGGVGIRVA